jgi:hypothetical protein
MKNGVKLFPRSIAALLLGVMLASPLIYISTVMAPATDGPELFDVTVSYVYIERQNTTTIGPPFDPIGTLDVPHTVYLFGINFTRLSDTIVPCDATLEVYEINIYSDKGLIETIQKFQGVYSEIVAGLGDLVWTEFFGDNLSGSFLGSAFPNWEIGESRLDIFSSGGSQLWEPDSEPETLSIIVNRLGWFTITGESNEAVVLSEPEVVAEVQLEKFRDGFLYNTVIPEDELSQVDLTNPFANFFKPTEKSPK